MNGTDKKIFACIDVGGTKTEALLFTGDGTVLDHFFEPGGTVIDLGFDEASDRYVRTAERLKKAAGGYLDHFYASIAAYDYTRGALDEDFRRKVDGIGKIRLEGDGPCLISAILGHNDGASMICGTGSSLCVRKGNEYHHIGGYGFLFDSCGSGYVLGRDAVRAVLRAHDGRRQPTVMAELIEKKCGESVFDHLDKFYYGGRAYIASMASVVFEARKMGDPVAERIFNTGARELAELAFAATGELGNEYRLILNGGIFANYPEYARAVSALCPEGVTTVTSDLPPIMGAAAEALFDGGVDYFSVKEKLRSGL